MLIQCPACHARAEVPQSKEGAKVRCGECGRVYAAIPTGERKARVSAGGNTGRYIGLGIGAAVLLMFVALSRKGGDDKAPVVAAEEPVERGTMTDSLGWDSEVVKVVREIHKAATAHEDAKLLSHVAPDHFHAWRSHLAAKTEDETAEFDLEAGLVAFRALPEVEQLTAQHDAVALLLEGESKELVADWKPYDGTVTHLTDDYAVVRVSATPIDGGTEKRNIEWELVRESRSWKAFRWERWLSDAEKKASRKKRKKGYEKVTLSDGSLVFEREPEPLPHLASTSPELAQRIDKLYTDLIDDEPKVYKNARRELIEIGKPSLPRLLTGLYEIPLDSMEQAIQVNAIVVTLRDISGEYFSFKPLALEGSAMGTTEERRQSAIKQWFAWWYRDGEKFEEKVLEDALEGLIELTDKEKAWLERNKN